MNNLSKARFPELAPQTPIAAKFFTMPYLPWGEFLIGLCLVLIWSLI